MHYFNKFALHACVLSCVWLFATSWTVAHQASLSMGFFRQEYWSGLPLPSPGDLLDPGIEPVSPALAGRSFTAQPSGKLCYAVGSLICVVQSNVYMSIPISQFIPPLSPPWYPYVCFLGILDAFWKCVHIPGYLMNHCVAGVQQRYGMLSFCL